MLQFNPPDRWSLSPVSAQITPEMFPLSELLQKKNKVKIWICELQFNINSISSENHHHHHHHDEDPMRHKRDVQRVRRWKASFLLLVRKFLQQHTSETSSGRQDSIHWNFNVVSTSCRKAGIWSRLLTRSTRLDFWITSHLNRWAGEGGIWRHLIVWFDSNGHDVIKKWSLMHLNASKSNISNHEFFSQCDYLLLLEQRICMIHN